MLLRPKSTPLSGLLSYPRLRGEGEVGLKLSTTLQAITGHSDNRRQKEDHERANYGDDGF